MTSVDDDEGIRAAQLREAWQNALAEQDALHAKIDHLEDELTVTTEALRDLYDAMQVLSSFVTTPFDDIRSGGWL